ncbi:sensor domain-containing diguanylate cyclase [Nocardia inohanensis]|uniref:sensor domain-containing diguanylate cyclase n=1 Tax=Nocardia inohanensis TaxID=209246 RepID=UPI000832545E|nr:sensor domain-containing diguanylate cyclase [Nocardia inohanensis]
MNENDQLARHSGLARAWWAALAESGCVPAAAREPQQLLGALAAELAAAVNGDALDAEVGERAGAALVAAGLTAAPVLGVSARVLSELATHCRKPDATARLAMLLAAFGQGYGAALHRARCRNPVSVEAAVADARRAADERFKIVFDHAAVAIAVGDTTGRLVDANRGLADMIGVPIERLLGASVYDFAHPDDRAAIEALVYENLVPSGSGTVKLEQRIQRADGSYGWASFAITFVKGSGGQADYLLAVGEDVTERHEMQDELTRQARHDPLTALPNRRHLVEQLDAMIAQAGDQDRVGLCFLDLDGFKQVNDHHGHGVGDRLLTAVADRFRRGTGADGQLIARIGGDEFVALIPHADAARVAAVSDTLLATLDEPIAVGDNLLRVSASIGSVLGPVAGADAEALLDAADTALFRAKADGKNRWVLHSQDLRADACPDNDGSS